MTVIAIQRIRDGALASATSTSLSIVNSVGAVVLAPTVIVPTSEGVYSYETNILPAGSYTATWVFTTTGLPTDTVSRAFTVDSPVEITEGISLMALERRVARMCGPYRKIRSDGMSTVNAISAPRLKSSIDAGTYEDSYTLRRALTMGDELISNFASDDRYRQISAFDAPTGILTVDRAYTRAPIIEEAIELHYLDPEEELRPAVLDGLERCFFWETLTITNSGSLSDLYNLNVTAIAPWLTEPGRIREVSFGYPNSILPPTRVQWWETYRSGKSVFLRSEGLGLGTLSILALRPVSSYVNQQTALGGPNDDLDVVYVDPQYAAFAGVLEIWKNSPERLQPLSVQNLRPTREDIANEFTKKSLALVGQVPETLQLRYGQADPLMQIGNLAEPAI